MASQFQVEHEGDVVVCNVDSMNSDSFLGALQSQWKGLKTMVETATSASVFLHARDDLAVTGSGTYIEDYQKCVSQIQQKSETPTLYVLSASNGSPRMLQNAGLAGKELEWPHVIWMVPTQVGMFLTTLIFILIGVLSFQCLLTIDAPDVFAEKPLSIEREY
ncbi:MAG: uncharacterized protein KVP18_001402 [Porospora cf. gigantea A]|uniref:uncharacterized protein n=1 Tax=Porospora cf. gigantea A TaxID=2853593 RepID=UPI00355A810E|nr:MAG: hypothetical protein KVP18_001402 [Porospora cf. gigantea A]